MSKRTTRPSKARMRNLVQFKDLSDDDFEEVFEEKYGSEKLVPFNPVEKKTRIEDVIKELGKDYDLSDMKANDLAQLRNYASLTLQLAELEDKIDEIQEKGIETYDVVPYEKLNNVASKVRSDISSIFQDLGINRKHRKSQNEQSVIDAITDIRRRAKKFIEGKMVYVFCPKCRMLLTTAWVHYKTEGANKLTCTCEHCGNVFTEDLGKLYETNHKNLEDVLIP